MLLHEVHAICTNLFNFGHLFCNWELKRSTQQEMSSWKRWVFIYMEIALHHSIACSSQVHMAEPPSLLSSLVGIFHVRHCVFSWSTHFTPWTWTFIGLVYFRESWDIINGAWLLLCKSSNDGGVMLNWTNYQDNVIGFLQN